MNKKEMAKFLNVSTTTVMDYVNREMLEKPTMEKNNSGRMNCFWTRDQAIEAIELIKERKAEKGEPTSYYTRDKAEAERFAALNKAF